jgi:hypothetical protein
LDPEFIKGIFLSEKIKALAEGDNSSKLRKGRRNKSTKRTGLELGLVSFAPGSAIDLVSNTG